MPLNPWAPESSEESPEDAEMRWGANRVTGVPKHFEVVPVAPRTHMGMQLRVSEFLRQLHGAPLKPRLGNSENYK